jgi:hypothetical protein
VPMQTIQLLGGSAGRASFLRCGLAHLSPGGVLAVALSPVLDLYEVGHDTVAPLPDVREVDGVVYASQPVAVRADADGFLLERRREIVTPAGERSVQENRIRLDRLDPDELEHEARATGLTPSGRAEVPATADYVGSVVVMLRA